MPLTSTASSTRPPWWAHCERARTGRWTSDRIRKGTVMVGTNDVGAISTVAVIGAGIMGSAMTRNLVAAGVSTRVWDGSAAATGPLGEAGAVVAASAQDAVRGADVVITMLPTADAVESVIFGDGVAGAFADGCVWAQMGTIGVGADSADQGPAGRAAAGGAVRGRAGVGQQGARRAGSAAGPGVGAGRGGRPGGPGVRHRGPQDRVAGRGGAGQRDEAGRQRLHVGAHRGRGGDHGARRPARCRPWAARRLHRGRPAGRADRGRQAAQDGPR